MIQPTPNPDGRPARLVDVSCPTASTCEAVGGKTRTRNGSLFGERWHDGAWRKQSLPVPPDAKFASLVGVDCIDGTHCVAVGVVRRGSVRTILVETYWS